ncbi:hypothetical protein C9975_02970, partial [Thalassospira xiamenensis]
FTGRKRRVMETAYNELLEKRKKFGNRAANPKTMDIYLNTHGYIAKTISKSPYGWAILARTNRVLDSIQAELAALDVDVIRIGGKSIWDSASIMGYVCVLSIIAKDSRIDDLDDALFYLQEHSDTIHEIHGKARNNKGLGKVPSDSIEALTGKGFELALEFIDKARMLNESDQSIEQFLSDLKGAVKSISKELSERENIFNVVNDIVMSFKGSFAKRVERLLSLASKRQKTQDIRTDNKVVLCTLNGSKGLQWPKVWLMDVEHNVLPIKAQVELDEDAEAERIEEERRLMFVAMTRAEELLRISWGYGKESIFIEEAQGF